MIAATTPDTGTRHSGRQQRRAFVIAAGCVLLIPLVIRQQA
jgi:hypothetical protein